VDIATWGMADIFFLKIIYSTSYLEESTFKHSKWLAFTVYIYSMKTIALEKSYTFGEML
jgi:hypothetical protein